MKQKITMVVMMTALILFAGQSAYADTEKGLRLSLGSAPGMDKVEFDGPGGVVSVDLDADSGINFNPAFVIRTGIEKPVGFVGVFGLMVRTHSGTDVVGDKVELTVWGVSAAPGLAVKLSDKAHLELKVELGLGAANQSITGATDGSGPYVSLGASAGAYFKLGKTFVLGADLGYSQFTSTGELDVAGTIIDTEFTGSGPTGNVSIGWMF